MGQISSDETIDKKWTRVTEILYPFSGLSGVDKKVLDNAARRGTKVHKLCETIVEGLGEWGVDEETQGYIDSFKKWWTLGHKVIAMEKRFFCEDLMITGQVDLIIEDGPGKAIILDIKTPLKASKTWLLQGTAYAYMARKSGYDISGIQFLKLDKFGGDPELYFYTEDFPLFSKTLEVFNYFFRKKKNAASDYPDL